MPETLIVPSADGTRIAVARSGLGPPLVIVHGTTVDHTDWQGLLPALERHFTVYAMDRRGHGSSDDAPDYDVAREYEDVSAVVDSVGGPVRLLGHSYGALCSIEAALLTHNIELMVLYEPPMPTGPNFHPEGMVERMEELTRQGDPEKVLETFLVEIVGQPAERVALQKRLPNWPARLALAHTVAREMRVTRDYQLVPERFSCLRMPVLFLLGGNSGDRLAGATRKLAEVMPNARIAVLPGQKHVAMHEARALFLQTVIDFLS